MKLPVRNREETMVKLVTYFMLGTFVVLILYYPSRNIWLLYILLIYYSFWIVLSIYLLKKNSIESVLLYDHSLLVSYKGEIEEIHLSKVTGIFSSFFGPNFKFRMKRRYVLHLSESYKFGDRIILIYDYNIGDVFFGDDPEAIKIVRGYIN